MILGRCPCGQAKVLASWFSRLSDRYFFPSEAIKTIRRAKKKFFEVELHNELSLLKSILGALQYHGIVWKNS